VASSNPAAVTFSGFWDSGDQERVLEKNEKNKKLKKTAFSEIVVLFFLFFFRTLSW
jgi:hypothetical protein